MPETEPDHIEVLWTDHLRKPPRDGGRPAIERVLTGIAADAEAGLTTLPGEFTPDRATVSALLKADQDREARRKPLSPQARLEQEFILLMLGRPDVTRIATAAISVPYRTENGKASYTPRFLVTRRIRDTTGPHLRSALIDVMTTEALAQKGPVFDSALKAAHLFCLARDFDFYLYTEAEVRTPELENTRHFILHRFHTADEVLESRIISELKDGLPRPYEAVASLRIDGYFPNEVRAAVRRMMACGLLRWRRTLRLNPQTPVSPAPHLVAFRNRKPRRDLAADADAASEKTPDSEEGDAATR